MSKRDNQTVGKRSYNSALRQRQQEATRSSIVSAAQQLILEGRIHNFTVQEVAQRAGVSHRTVYIHFPSREEILSEVVRRGEEEAARLVPPYPQRLEDFPAWVEEAVPALMRHLSSVRATYAVLGAIFGDQPTPGARERDALFARLVAEATPNLTDRERNAATASLRLWLSMRTFIELQGRYGLDEEELKLAGSRGVRALIDDLKGLEAASRKGKAG